MWDLLAQWVFAVFAFGVMMTMIMICSWMEERRLAKMTEQERYEEWVDRQW